MRSWPRFMSKAISDASSCRCEGSADTVGAGTRSAGAVGAGALPPDHVTCKLLRSTTVSSASRNSTVRSMTPTKPWGGLITARWRSAAASRHPFGAAGVPGSSIDPGASPLITTLTLKPPSQYKMVSGAGSSARNSRTAPTVNRGVDVRAGTVSGVATGAVATIACSGWAIGDGCSRAAVRWMWPAMYPPTPPAITAMPMNHTVAPNERLGGSGGTATMSFFGEIRPSSSGATSVEGPAGCLHGGSGLNSVPGDNNGSERSGRRPVPGAYDAGPCSDGLCSDGPCSDGPPDLSSDGPAPWGSPATADMIPLAF